MDTSTSTKKFKYGVTHGGAAHADDELCIKLLFAIGAVDTIFRRDPLPEELSDPDIVVFDIGGQYDPPLGNFDHHQLHEDDNADCAAWMLARWFGLHDKLIRLYPWYDMLGVIDSKGLVTASRGAGTNSAVALKFMSQDSELVTGMLRGVTSLRSDSDLGKILTTAGESILAAVAAYSEFDAIAGDGLVVKWVNGVCGFDATGLRDKVPEHLIGKFLAIKRDELVASVGSSSDGVPAWSLSFDSSRGRPSYVGYRFANDKRVDFKKAAGLPGVMFIHANGFLVKCEPDADIAYDILAASVNPESPEA